MRFIHTADWHLGKLFHGQHLTSDQEYILEQLIGIVRDSRPDALIVAGDIYDRAVPPPEAVRLLDHVLCEVVLGAEVPVVLIAGNHDSPERLGFASRLLSQRGLHAFSTISVASEPVSFRDAHGPVHFYAIPYADPPQMRNCLRDTSIGTHQDGMRSCLDRVRTNHPRGERSVLVAHAFVTGGTGCDSERPLSVGGADHVEIGTFAEFDYVALGHLHRPQALDGGRVRYAGSLLKYSFSEADQSKKVHIVEMDRDGRCAVEDVPLIPRRDVRCIRGRFMDLLSTPSGNPDDYILVELEDEGPILDAVTRLREVYPNLLHLQRVVLSRGAASQHARPDFRSLDDQELFARFFLDVTEMKLAPPQQDAFRKVLGRVDAVAREVVP